MLLKVPVKKEMRAGITGIQKNMSKKNKADQANISKAFQDLDVLINMAKPMVALSKSISTKIRDKQGEITEDETVQFKSYLLRSDYLISLITIETFPFCSFCGIQLIFQLGH